MDIFEYFGKFLELNHLEKSWKLFRKISGSFKKYYQNFEDDFKI